MVSDRHPDQAIYLDPEPTGPRVWTRWVPHIVVEVVSPGGEDREHEDAAAGHGRFADLFDYPHFWLAVFAQFLYVGAQVGTWSYFITYVHDYAHQPEKSAGYYLTGSLVAFMIGRFFATFLMGYVAPRALMGIYSVINMALVAIGVVAPGWLGVSTILL